MWAVVPKDRGTLVYIILEIAWQVHVAARGVLTFA
jgi:hypothetical protein